jgi:enoyl-CoA hydratase/carnithine racemase
MTEPEVICTVKGSVGHILLNRPRAFNSLTLPMIQGIHTALDDWWDKSEIKAVVIEGAGEKAFCSGGDLRLIYGAKENPAYGEEIFAAEYTLNYKIHKYPKPYIAFLDGVSMGGGIGISIYGSHRIVTEHTKFAMPECAIGLFPDIGASWFFQKAPGHIGRYLALTGKALDAADSIYVGVGTHFISRRYRADLLNELTKVKNFDEADDIIERFSANAGAPSLLREFDSIDEHFRYSSLIEIWNHLDDSEWGRHVKAVMAGHSPTSLAITFQSMELGRGKELKEILHTDFNLSQNILRGHDFYEGIRALVIDKNKNPKWQPDDLKRVDYQDIQQYFQEVPSRYFDL